MSVLVKIPTQLRAAAGGEAETEVDGKTVQEVLDGLFERHDELRSRLYDEQGGLRRFVNGYVAGEDIRFLDGLAPPVSHPYHDAANGFGGFASLIDNRTARDQLRLVVPARDDFFQIPYDPVPNDFENQQYDSSGLRDAQHETDSFAVFSWVRTLGNSAVLEASPFYHFNRADYSPNLNDLPVATTSNRGSNVVTVQPDPRVPEGIGQLDFPADGTGPAELIDARVTVTDMRVETIR